MGVCALCRAESDLRRSHVIPRFTQKRIKGEHGSALRFRKEGPVDGVPMQDYFFEHLLCGACEARFQKWEDYAARTICQRRIFDIRPTRPRQFAILQCDYRRMKLFLLSVLWRMGASQRPDFENIDLGPHLDRIGDMLLAAQPGESHEYGCCGIVVQIDKERMAMTLAGDTVRGPKGIRFHRALIDGILFAWVVGSPAHMSAFQPRQLLLQEDGTWCVRTEDWRSVEFIAHQIDLLMGAAK
jgi:hypothetical protein